jgi:hypothetical protein
MGHISVIMNSFFYYLLDREEGILDKRGRISFYLEFNDKILEIWYRSFGLKKYGLELK